MLNPIDSPLASSTTLRLNEALKGRQKSRLLSCGAVHPERGADCKVFLKRSRHSNQRLLESLLQLEQKQQRSNRQRARRRGTYLRLALKPQGLRTRAEA